MASFWTLTVFLSPVNLTLEVSVTSTPPQRWGKWRLSNSSCQSLNSTLFYTSEGDEIFYGLWAVRLLENQWRTKQDNLPHFIYSVSERPHPEVLSHKKKIGILTWTVQPGDIFKYFLLFLSNIISHSQEIKTCYQRLESKIPVGSKLMTEPRRTY